MKKTINDYFYSTVHKYPQNIALADSSNSINFTEFKNISESIADTILSFGIIRKPVAIFMKRSAKLPTAIMGILLSGNFYAVLDYESPVARIHKIIDTLQPSAVLYESEYEDTVKKFSKNIRCIKFEDAENRIINDYTALKNAEKNMTSDDIAYTLFTSGSTGVPKGAVLTHSNVISYIHWFINCFDIDEKTVFGSQTSMYFSMSVSDFYSCIFAGACYQIIPKEYFTFPAKLISFMNERKINAVYWVPTALGMVAKFNLFKYSLPQYLTKVLFAGEVMPVKYLNYWRKYLPDIMYANLFGPTETTDICAFYKVDRSFDENESLPIGIPCDNCNLFLTDENGVESDEGELYVKSPFVAKGYYKSQEKTNEAFVQNPLHNDYPDTVYKTGDLVKYNKYGELEYIGRKDFQIKHLGYRIEPSEIENVLNSVEGVELTVCVYGKEKDELILAYEGKKDIKDRIKIAAIALLPNYMQPQRFEHFEVFPKNSNGKTDRKEITRILTENERG